MRTREDYIPDLEFPAGQIIGNHKIYGIGHNSEGEIVLLTDTDDIIITKKEDKQEPSNIAHFAEGKVGCSGTWWCTGNK